MDDLISRKAAIAEVEQWAEHGYDVIHWTWIKAMLEVQSAMNATPVIHGRWQGRRVEYTEDTAIDAWQSAKCTNCGKYHTTPYLYYFEDYKFCPNCGAKMDGERRDSE